MRALYTTINASDCLPSMPSLCAGMPPITTQYAPNIKRRDILKSATRRAKGPFALCVVFGRAIHPAQRASRWLLAASIHSHSPGQHASSAAQQQQRTGSVPAAYRHRTGIVQSRFHVAELIQFERTELPVCMHVHVGGGVHMYM